MKVVLKEIETSALEEYYYSIKLTNIFYGNIELFARRVHAQMPFKRLQTPGEKNTLYLHELWYRMHTK